MITDTSSWQGGSTTCGDPQPNGDAPDSDPWHEVREMFDRIATELHEFVMAIESESSVWPEEGELFPLVVKIVIDAPLWLLNYLVLLPRPPPLFFIVIGARLVELRVTFC